VIEFIQKGSVSRLNVAGPRASKCPEAYVYVRVVIEKTIVSVMNAASL
jgi:hypothetical protein